ncbi:MAG: GGDEF domain-containing protein [Gammaproteobacteria bacterium]
MTEKKSNPGESTVKTLFDIESKDRFNSNSIESLCDKPDLLKQYFEFSIANTFSELMFRLTHEVYAEEKASDLWHKIAAHRENLKNELDRDIGLLVAALDYLSNISGEISNPKIIDDLRIEEAAALATRDNLTGLYLRSVFDFSLDRMINEHRRYDKNLSLLLLDIDDFKHVNDRCGHQAGDEVLRKIGEIIRNGMRQSDLAARYGGEEIGIILRETSIGQAIFLANRLREDVCQYFAEDGAGITVSIGISGIREPDITSVTELVRHADRALYQAKRTGKNRVSDVV